MVGYKDSCEMWRANSKTAIDSGSLQNSGGRVTWFCCGAMVKYDEELRVGRLPTKPPAVSVQGSEGIKQD